MSAPDADPLLRGEAEDDLGLENPSSRRYLYAPMSYDEVITEMRPRWSPMYWYDVARRNRHVLDMFRPPDAVRGVFSKVRVGLSRMWPQNRAQQAIIVMMLLWFGVTYADWTTEVLLPSRPFNEAYSSVGGSQYADLINGKQLSPLPEDGVIAENATWSTEYCWSTGRPLREPSAIRCLRWSNFYIDPLPDERSLASTDNVFLYIDPPRTGARTSLTSRDEHQHGAIASRVFMVAGPPNSELPVERRGKVGINVTAVYDKSASMLVGSSLVARLEKGRFSGGVEVLTHDVQLDDRRYTKHDSVRYDVVVSVPADQAVDAFVLEATNCEVHAFSDKAYNYVKDMVAAPIAKEQDRKLERVFGNLALETRNGLIELGSTLRALGRVSALTDSADVRVLGSVAAPSIVVKSTRGNVRMRSGGRILGGYDASITLKDGSMMVDNGAEVWGTALSFSSERGSVVGEGIWFVNHTLSMRADAGSISAAIGVDKPDMFFITYDDQKKEGEGKLLSVDISSVNGSIDANYVMHLGTMPLRSSVKTSRGSARVRHAPEFEGKVSARGASAGLHKKDVPGRTITSSSHRSGAVEEIEGIVAWDPALRPKLPADRAKPWDNGTAPVDLGARSNVESEFGSVEIVFA
ncbi:hypothetical protein MCUN1_000745 [Malassezia cuniculi]|uniref:Uncharacterized protein n=1 Tax=Malassezia cuniculi TaxID=948313 RepID=A0AAF0ES98_9BASI|nr:hypothetical protein MCUN1_000745 [Malassezia cuniculi]